MTTALVTGASGILGRMIVDRLLQEGVHVRALLRARPAPPPLPASVDVVHGDIRDVDLVRRAAETADVVFHLAALVHASPSDRPSLADYAAVNEEGTANVAAAAEDFGSRVVLFSTINVYGRTGGSVVDETAECRPEGAYAITKRNAERILQCLGNRATILRLAAVFGRSMKGNYPRLVRAVCGRRFVRIGSGVARKTVIHDSDVVRAAILAAFTSGAGGQIYNVTDGAIHTIDAIIDAIAEACGVPPPKVRVPPGLARISAFAIDAVGAVVGRPLAVRQSVDKYLEDVAVSGEKIQHQLGFVPAIDLRSGWQMALR